MKFTCTYLIQNWFIVIQNIFVKRISQNHVPIVHVFRHNSKFTQYAYASHVLWVIEENKMNIVFRTPWYNQQ